MKGGRRGQPAKLAILNVRVNNGYGYILGPSPVPNNNNNSYGYGYGFKLGLYRPPTTM